MKSNMKDILDKKITGGVEDDDDEEGDIRTNGEPTCCIFKP